MTDQIQNRTSDAQVQELTPDELEQVSGGTGTQGVHVVYVGGSRYVESTRHQTYVHVPPTT